MGLSLEETADALGRLRWWERATFEVLGAWASQVPEVAAKVHLATVCYHHAWHGELLAGELSEIEEFSAATRTRAGSRALEDWWTGLVAPEETAVRLASIYRLLVPRQLVAYRALAGRLSEVSGRPTLRVIEIMVRDHELDRADGERVLQGLLDPDLALECARHVGEREAALLRAGGLSTS